MPKALYPINPAQARYCMVWGGENEYVIDERKARYKIKQGEVENHFTIINIKLLITVIFCCIFLYGVFIFLLGLWIDFRENPHDANYEPLMTKNILYIRYIH